MKRILVIEDDPSQRQLFKTALEQAGYVVLDAPNGEAGFRLFCQQPCDLVITDIYMPEKEGLETILELKAQFLNVKIIAISGGGRRTRYNDSLGVSTALEAAKDFGADRTLPKPVRLQELLRMASELLTTHSEETV